MSNSIWIYKTTLFSCVTIVWYQVAHASQSTKVYIATRLFYFCRRIQKLPISCAHSTVLARKYHLSFSKISSLSLSFFLSPFLSISFSLSLYLYHYTHFISLDSITFLFSLICYIQNRPSLFFKYTKISTFNTRLDLNKFLKYNL